MQRILFLLFILYSLFVVSTMLAAAESQTWKVRPGDNLDIIATTLEIPKEEIKKHNPGVGELSPNQPKAETAASILSRE